MHTHEICPPLLSHPGWHLLTHTHRDRCHTLELWAAVQSTWGAWGYSALLEGSSAMTARWTDTPPAVSFINLFDWREWESNRQLVIGRPILSTEPQPNTIILY